MNPNLIGVIGPWFLNQVRTLVLKGLFGRVYDGLIGFALFWAS